MSWTALLTVDELESATPTPPLAAVDAAAGELSRVGISPFPDAGVALVSRQGRRVMPPIVINAPRLVEEAALVLRTIEDQRIDLALVDDSDDRGAWLLNILQTAGVRVVAARLRDEALSRRYLTRRAESAFALRDWFRAGGAVPASRRDEHVIRLRKELAELRYTDDGAGKLALEEPAALAQRLGWWPATSTALLATFGLPDETAVMRRQRLESHRAITDSPDFDPWEV